jgi:hypothetical protein
MTWKTIINSEEETYGYRDRQDKEKGEIETEKNGKRSKIIIKKKGRQKQRYYLWEEKDNYSEWVRARDEKTDR